MTMTTVNGDHPVQGKDEPVSHLINGETQPSKTGGEEETRLVIQSFRLLIADLCQQFNMGHPGYAPCRRFSWTQQCQKRLPG